MGFLFKFSLTNQLLLIPVFSLSIVSVSLQAKKTAGKLEEANEGKVSRGFGPKFTPFFPFLF